MRDAPAGETIRRLLTEKERACERYLRTVARSLGVGDTEIRALLCVARDGALEPARLGEQVGLSPIAAGSLVARLTADGLLERAPHPRDGRSTVLTLSEAGGLLVQERFADLAERIDDVYERLPGDQREIVAGFLAQLADASAEAVAALEADSALETHAAEERRPPAQAAG